MKIDKPYCPLCGKLAQGTLEQLTGRADLKFAVKADGEGIAEYTKVFWTDHQVTVAHCDMLHLLCPSGHAWYSAVAGHQEAVVLTTSASPAATSVPAARPGLERALEIVNEQIAQEEQGGSHQGRRATEELEVVAAKLRAALAGVEQPAEVRARRVLAATAAWSDADVAALSPLALRIILSAARAFSARRPEVREAECGSQVALELLSDGLLSTYHSGLHSLVPEGDVIDRAVEVFCEALEAGAPPVAASEYGEGAPQCLWCQEAFEPPPTDLAPAGSRLRQEQDMRDVFIPGFTVGHLAAAAESGLCQRCWSWAVEVSHQPQRAVWALAQTAVLRERRLEIYSASRPRPTSMLEIEAFNAEAKRQADQLDDMLHEQLHGDQP